MIENPPPYSPFRPVIFDDLVSNMIRRNDKFVGSGSGDDFNVEYDDINYFRCQIMQ